MRPTPLVVLAATLVVSSCLRSAQDRELDRVFAHQKALRDSTASVVGVVVDAVTGAPVRGVSLWTSTSGGMSDTSGRFVIRYVPRGAHWVSMRRPGYRTDSALVEVLPPQSGNLTFRARRADRPCCSLEGRWTATFWLDSSAVGQRPTGRVTQGEVKLWPLRGTRTQWSGDPWVAEYSGYFEVSFIPFWGSQIAEDVSTTFVTTDDAHWSRSVHASAFNGDWTEWEFIPNLSHGGVSLWGRWTAMDTVTGVWEQRAYSRGASGRFLLAKASPDAGARPTPAIRPSVPPDTLLDADAGYLFVRLWDDAAGRYVQGRYALQLDEETWISSFPTKASAEGWGSSHKYEPGRYQVSLERYPCGTREFRPRKSIKVPFVIRAGERTNVTIRMNSLHVRPARAYDNTEGRRCSIDPRTPVPAVPDHGG